jgi:hypothetical protein
LETRDTAQRGGAPTKERGCIVPTSHSGFAKPRTLERNPTPCLSDVLRLVEDDTAAFRAFRGNRRGLRRFREILIDLEVCATPNTRFAHSDALSGVLRARFIRAIQRNAEKRRATASRAKQLRSGMVVSRLVKPAAPATR